MSDTEGLSCGWKRASLSPHMGWGSGVQGSIRTRFLPLRVPYWALHLSPATGITCPNYRHKTWACALQGSLSTQTGRDEHAIKMLQPQSALKNVTHRLPPSSTWTPCASVSLHPESPSGLGPFPDCQLNETVNLVWFLFFPRDCLLASCMKACGKWPVRLLATVCQLQPGLWACIHQGGTKAASNSNLQMLRISEASWQLL